MVCQNQLNKQINMINKDPLLFIPADKSNNLCKTSKNTYNKLLQNKIATELKPDKEIKQFN